MTTRPDLYDRIGGILLLLVLVLWFLHFTLPPAGPAAPI